MKHIHLSAILLLCSQLAAAQNSLPVIKAGSRQVDIIDGQHLKKGNWYTFADRKPDYYYVELPEKPHNVKFVTDQDSISFDITYRGTYDFIILQNGKDSCHTRISATYRKLLPHQSPPGVDTIPFTLGDNSKIYLRGTINGSQPLDIQFDLGAGGTVIKKASVPKVNMQFDKTTMLHNSDGSHEMPFSTINKIQIGHLSWDSVPIVVGNNMTNREDFIIGNSLFLGKVVEINYDKQIMLIHDALPPVPASYSRHDFIMDAGVLPHIEASLTYRGKTKKGWVMFDTGANTTIITRSSVSNTDRLLDELKKMIGFNDKHFAPSVKIGGYALHSFNYKTREMGSNGVGMILGNDMMKRFNVILDNRHGHVYLRPNSLAKVPYRHSNAYWTLRMMMGIVIVMVGVIVYWRKKKVSSR